MKYLEIYTKFLVYLWPYHEKCVRLTHSIVKFSKIHVINLAQCEQFFGGTELENGFEKSKYFTTLLGDRTKKHVPSNIRNRTAPQREQPPRSCRSRKNVKTSDSAIGQNLLDNPDCAKLNNDDMFRIVGRARSSFHLAILESIYIQTKKPPLSRQKEFVVSLGLQW